MKAAVVHAFNQPPVYEDFEDPVPADGESLVTVRAAGLHPLVKRLAAGAHYGSDHLLPMIPGVDGVAHTANGRRVYFGMLRAPYGTMAERAAVSAMQLPLPDTLGDARAAAIMNPGMSSWLALTVRARLEPGETVLVLGATGAAGGLAVQIAKRLGAARVIAAGRNERALARLLHLGADATLRLDQSQDDVRLAIAKAAGDAGIDVIVDYVWGAPTEAAIAAIPRKGLRHSAPRVRLVQVGDLAGATIALPADILRSSGLEVLGSGGGSVPMAKIVDALPVFLALAAKDLELEVDEVPLSDVAWAWNLAQGARRVVLVPSHT